METGYSEKRIGNIFRPGGTTWGCPLGSRVCVARTCTEAFQELRLYSGCSCKLFDHSIVRFMIRGREVLARRPVMHVEQYGAGGQQFLEGPPPFQPLAFYERSCIRNVGDSDRWTIVRVDRGTIYSSMTPVVLLFYLLKS